MGTLAADHDGRSLGDPHMTLAQRSAALGEVDQLLERPVHQSGVDRAMSALRRSRGLNPTVRVLRKPDRMPRTNGSRRLDGTAKRVSHIQAQCGVLHRAGTMGGSNELEGRRVLIVEDEAVVSLMIADLLTDAGCIVVGPAATTKAAFAFIEEESIDCAVLDVKLTDGLAFPVADALSHRVDRRGASSGTAKPLFGVGEEAVPAFQRSSAAKVPDSRALRSPPARSRLRSSSARRLAVSTSSDHRADGDVGGRKQVDREDRRCRPRRGSPNWQELDLSAVEASQVVTLAMGDGEPVGAAATRAFDCQMMGSPHSKNAVRHRSPAIVRRRSIWTIEARHSN